MSAWIRWITFLSLAFCCLWLTASCEKKEQNRQPLAERKLNVVTTVAPITSIVENVAGDRVKITGIIPEGINSHTFEPIPSDSKFLSRRRFDYPQRPRS